MFAICSADSSDIARFCLAGNAEPVEFESRRSFADAEVDAAVRDEVERGQALGGACRVVVVGDHLSDPVTEPDVRRARRSRGEEHLGRRRVRVLVEEVVFDLPGVVEAEPVGEFDLVECLVEQAILVVVAPRLGELVLVEDPELHAHQQTTPVCSGRSRTVGRTHCSRRRLASASARARLRGTRFTASRNESASIQ